MLKTAKIQSTVRGEEEVLANVQPGGTFIHREFDGWTVRYPNGRRVGWQGVVMIRLEKSSAAKVAELVDTLGDDMDTDTLRCIIEQWVRLTGEEWEVYSDRFWETYRAAVARGEDFTQHLRSL